MKYKVAAVQMCSSNHVKGNLRLIEEFVEEAVKQKAELVCFPENCAFMGKNQTDVLDVAEPLQLEDFDWAKAPIQSKFARLAKEYQVYIIAGSIPVRSVFKEKVYQTQIVFNPEGKIANYYHKIHLFDVNVPGDGKYQESASFMNDRHPVVTPIEDMSVGLSICYDLRFPELYRKLAQEGANVFTVPSAFTFKTGKAHWLPLLKARAIENLAYVIAPAQFGLHPNDRQTYGHSIIIDPWGKVLAVKDIRQGVITADIDLDLQAKIRAEFPVLTHAQLL